MLKRIKHNVPTDANKPGRHSVDLSTSNTSSDIPAPTKAQVSQVMAQLGRKGGKIGGKRRLETMTPEERSAVASNAAKARWEKMT